MLSLKQAQQLLYTPQNYCFYKYFFDVTVQYSQVAARHTFWFQGNPALTEAFTNIDQAALVALAESGNIKSFHTCRREDQVFIIVQSHLNTCEVWEKVIYPVLQSIGYGPSKK